MKSLNIEDEIWCRLISLHRIMNVDDDLKIKLSSKLRSPIRHDIARNQLKLDIYAIHK